MYVFVYDFLGGRNMSPIYQSSTDIRKNFSMAIDKAVHDRPQFIQRTRDHAVLLGEDFLNAVLANIKFTCNIQHEEDKTIILTNNQISDIIASGKTLDEAKSDMAAQLYDYALEYYTEFGLYSRTPNRKDHVPYVIKLLMTNDLTEIEGMLVCRNGKN